MSLALMSLVCRYDVALMCLCCCTMVLPRDQYGIANGLCIGRVVAVLLDDTQPAQEARPDVSCAQARMAQAKRH